MVGRSKPRCPPTNTSLSCPPTTHPYRRFYLQRRHGIVCHELLPKTEGRTCHSPHPRKQGIEALLPRTPAAPLLSNLGLCVYRCRLVATRSTERTGQETQARTLV